MNSDIKLKFGKYKGCMLKDVPDNYLKWCIEKEVLRGKALLYAKQKTNYPKCKWEVTVEDSVGSDGKYIVEAYNWKHATSVCQKQYGIQNTQSFCGTSYSATKL